ncbi:hypothetical protein [Kitasatospora viridis]|uniref:Uncharacterized protein n=1 Tax=Kitasatospora viridis TaxID=281105 RepID=A0A561SES7_9ACTN|nr:hypothetical protein [Kitasatospora viridis]TWF73337.1 hypothetical protein FHX73_16488 [Kitasatospora viridis]
MNRDEQPRTADPRTAWSRRDGPADFRQAPRQAPQEALQDTLQIDACASSWAELALALSDAEVPLEVGDTAVLRALSKLDPVTIGVLARWLRTAGGRPGDRRATATGE